MAKEMLINVSEGEECRIALLDDGRLEELYMERTSSTSHVGNIYKGKVTNVEASIQAAFIDFGLGRNGFLHISDLMPTYFGRKGEDIVETVGKKMARRDRPPIQRCLRRGDEIIVQIIKEGIGTKGPTLSTYLSIPGRYLVMMPGVGKMGVSQKIEDEVERRRLRQILDQLKPPKDVGFIIRTAGVGKSKLEIERDLKYLTRLWETLEKKRIASKGAAELYAEGDLVTRTVRDFFSTDVDRIVVDNEDVASRVKEVIKISTPRAKNKVELYDETVPLFHKYGIEREIEQMYSRHVPLPSGGSLVIDSTEAIVAIDVNSGKFRDHSDAEMTAFKTDMEAADEIPRQLKLRDLGGVIICDFIDLRYERHRRELEKRLHDNFKKDRAKTKVLRMSQFGIIEMTRQRMRASLKRSIYFDCPHCKGAGLVKTPESMSLDVMRRIAIAINDLKVERVELAVCPDVAFYLQNKKRVAIAELEQQYKKRVLIRSDQSLGLDEMRLELFDNRDGLVVLPELDVALSQPSHKTQLNTKPHGAPRQQQQQPQGGRNGGGGATRFDDRRRDHGRRGPQQQPQQQRRGGPPVQPVRRDEEDSRLDDRFDLEETEADEVSAAGGSRRDSQPPVPGQNGPGGPQDLHREGEPGEGGHRRRRRRRGRRGRGRNRQQEGQPMAGQPMGEGFDDRGPAGEPADDRGGPVDEYARAEDAEDRAHADTDDEGYPLEREPADVEPIGEAPGEITEDEESSEFPPREAEEPVAEVSEETAAATSESEPEQSDRPRGRRRRGGRGRGRGAKQSAAAEKPPAQTSDEDAQPTTAADAADAEGGAATTKKPRRRRGGRGRGGKAAASAASQAAESSNSESRAAKPSPPPVLPARRTGSADKHLIRDEPIIPEPPRRPRSSRDLDEIPDDLD